MYACVEQSLTRDRKISQEKHKNQTKQNKTKTKTKKIQKKQPRQKTTTVIRRLSTQEA